MNLSIIVESYSCGFAYWRYKNKRKKHTSVLQLDEYEQIYFLHDGRACYSRNIYDSEASEVLSEVFVRDGDRLTSTLTGTSFPVNPEESFICFN